MSRSLNLDKLKNRKTIEISSKEALKDVNVCEWDVIGDIFAKAIKEKGLSEEQIDGMKK